MGVALSITDSDGVERPATSSIVNADMVEVPCTVGVFPPGYPSVDAMIRQRPFYVGHRGNSAEDTEGALRGYTQAAARGVGALEISCGLTADDVWVSLHDETINRTSAVTGLPPVRSMTWDQVRQYQIVTPPGAPARPYTPVADIIAAYGSSHVLFMDPKYRHSDSRAKFFDLVATVPNATDRVVIKYFGDNVSLASAANQRGYAAWGYFYEANIATGVLAQCHHAWPILGMAWDASQSAWDTILALAGDRPVMGHIVPTAAAAATALAKGARGLMVSGARSVVTDHPLI